MARILIAEDDRRISSFLEKGLKASGFSTVVADDGERAQSLGRSDQFDLLILDMGLPEREGLSVLRELRSRGKKMPVLVLTGRRDRDAAMCLEHGADDYMTKPFEFVELLARVRARLRPSGDEDATALHAGPVRLDLRTRRATVGDRTVDLTAREFALLETLLRHADHVLSRQQLLSHVWGYSFEPDTNVVNVYINALRKKLGAHVIETVRGAGYRLPGSAGTSAAPAPPPPAGPLDDEPDGRPAPTTPAARRPLNGHARPAGRGPTAFAIVMLTDIVDSTAQQVAVGERAWRQLIDRHDRVAHESITRRGGRIVKRMGAGLLATLSEPSAALESAVELVAAMADAELPVRAGMHAGVIEMADDGDVRGMTVNIAARVQAHAEPHEILVSRTIRDLLLDGPFTFVDRGEHELKGLDNAWRVYAATR
jgi:DNA-binding response OmpR family regulator/class 3 adenylate cyclase